MALQVLGAAGYTIRPSSGGGLPDRERLLSGSPARLFWAWVQLPGRATDIPVFTLPRLLAQAPPPSHRPRRQGRRPIRLKGVKSAGDIKADVVVSSQEAADARQAAALGKLFKNCRVTIVVDSVVGGTEGRLFPVPPRCIVYRQ